MIFHDYVELPQANTCYFWCVSLIFFIRISEIHEQDLWNPWTGKASKKEGGEREREGARKREREKKKKEKKDPETFAANSQNCVTVFQMLAKTSRCWCWWCPMFSMYHLWEEHLPILETLLNMSWLYSYNYSSCSYSNTAPSSTCFGIGSHAGCPQSSTATPRERPWEPGGCAQIRPHGLTSFW